jgi:predicted RNA-binding protein associated with RNAse of E/G family
MNNRDQVTVIKQDLHGQETWRYTGKVLQVEADHILLEAFFDREDIDLEGVVLQRGDRFVETYYFDRWYNIFEVHDRQAGRIKVFYCNVGFPAQYTDHTVSYRDLALDLLVFPNGRQVVLDQDEFEALPLDEATRKKALEALEELKNRFPTQS